MSAYHRPETLNDALELLSGGGCRVAAGCTDLYPLTQAQALPGDMVDITAIPELRGISRDANGWRIGGATTWTDVIRADLPPAFDGLKAAAREVGSVQIQNAGTVAGNLCTASPAADGVPCLLTLDASVALASTRGRREIPLSDFLTGARQTALEGDELVEAIHVPASAGQGQGAFEKLGARRYLVISIAMAAARVEFQQGRIASAALAVGACSPVALRLGELEQALIGCPVAEAPGVVTPDHLAALSPIDDIRADAGYRRGAAQTLVRRLLSGLAPAERAA